MRDQRTKKAFIKYLKDPKNKDLRFWQALSAFSGECIFFGKNTHNGGGTFTDTFHIEADEERKNDE